MANLSDEERRALDLLDGHSDGCDDAVLLARGVTVGQLAGLVIDEFATGSVAHTAVNGREKPGRQSRTSRRRREPKQERHRSQPCPPSYNFAVALPLPLGQY
jgi:hypothetical protein